MHTTSPLLSTKVDILDDDHEQLLFHLQDVAYSADITVEDVDGITHQVREHFDHEQPYLEMLGGELQRRHTYAHGCFLRKLEEIGALCADAPVFAQAELIALTAQFISHTNTDDLEIAAALKQRGIVEA